MGLWKEVGYLVCLYLIGPASVVFLFQVSNLGRLDLYLVLLTFSSLFVFNLKSPVKYFILLLISIVAYLIHHVFLFTYFPIIAALLIYSIYENNYSKKTLIAVGSVICSVIVFFFYTFLFIKHTNTQAEITTYLSAKTNMLIYEPAVYFEELASLSEHIQSWVMVNLVHSILGFIMTVLLLSPLFYFFCKVWKITYNHADKKKKRIFLWMFLCNLAYFGPYCFTLDIPRWLAAFIINQFVIILFLVYKKDGDIVLSIKRFGVYMRKHAFLSIFFLLWLSALGLFNSCTFFDIIEKLLYHIFGIFVKVP
jgi:hypothetical protein